MPPQSSQDDFPSLFTKFGNLLDTSRLTPGTIKTPAYFKGMATKLRKLKHSELLDASYLVALAQKLETLGSKGYSRLDPTIFSTLVEAAMISVPCIEVERIVCQLGTSLSNDTMDFAEEEAVAIRKTLIGKSCLIQAMKYFADEKNARCVRRWIGLLCTHLVDGCKSNQDTLDMGPEKVRRQLGRMVMNEPDEILKIIGAHLIRSLHASGTPLEFLWPEETDRVYYEGFPPATQGETGWGQAFQNYVDDLYEKVKGPAAIGEIFSATDMVIQPGQTFGANHNVVLFIDDKKIFALAPSHSGTNPRLFDIHLSSLVQMTMVMNSCSQVLIARVALHMAMGVKSTMCIDAQPSRISQISFSMEPIAFDSFETALSGKCSELKVVKPDGGQSLSNFEDHALDSQKLHTSICEILVRSKDSVAETAKAYVDATTDLTAEPSSKASVQQNPSPPKLDKGGGVSPSSAQSPQPDLHESDSDIFDASPLNKKSRFVAEASIISSVKAKPTVPKVKILAVKPKAKIPIAPKSQRSGVTTSSPSQASNNAFLKNISESSVPSSKSRASAKLQMANQLTTSKASKNDDFDYDVPGEEDNEPLSKPPKKRGAPARMSKTKGAKERKSLVKTQDPNKRPSAAAVQGAAKNMRSSQSFQTKTTIANVIKQNVEEKTKNYDEDATKSYEERIGDLDIDGDDSALNELAQEGQTHELQESRAMANASKDSEKNSRKSGNDMAFKLDSLLEDVDMDHGVVNSNVGQAISSDIPSLKSNLLSTTPKILLITPAEALSQELEPAVQENEVIDKSSSNRKRKNRDEPSDSLKRQCHDQSHKDVEVNELEEDGNMNLTVMEKAPVTATKEQSSTTNVIIKDSSRKPALIAFSLRGPENQGPSSTIKKTSNPNSGPFHGSGSKRKRELIATADGSPPNKRRQNSSPFAKHDDGVVIYSSPPNPALSVQRPKPASKPSSQGSRVDHNGSPSGQLGQDDHFEKLIERLAEAPAESQMSKAPTEEPQLPQGSQIFGPKVELSSNKGKAKPSSPMQITIRYVAHEKLDKGGYKKLHTDEVIPFESEMPDPFIEKAKRPTGFTERLRSSMQETATSSKSPCQQPKPDRNQAKEQKCPVTTGNISREKSEKAQSTPSEMTTGTSHSSSQNSRKPLEEKSDLNQVWNMAIRPHYATLQSAVHRVADEMIIRLSDEETRVNLVVQQYQENGNHIVQSFTKTRESERASVIKSLDTKKADIMGTYNAAQNGISEVEKGLKQFTTTMFEGRWATLQQDISKRVSEGRSNCGGH